MTSIGGVTLRWLLAVVGVAAAAVSCQSSPDGGPAASGPAPVVQGTPSPSLAPGDSAGSPAPPVGGTASTSGGSAASPELPRCHTVDLAVDVGRSDSGTGHTGLNLALVNRSTHRCRVYGYGGVQLLDPVGAALPTHQVRGQPAPTLITLPPGGRAYSSLYWVFSPEVPPCSKAAFLLVTPPDETEPVRVGFSYTVCDGGRIQQGAYRTTPV